MPEQIIYTTNYSTTYGDLILGSINGKLCLCDWRYRKMRDKVDTRLKSFFNAEYNEELTPVVEDAIIQLNDYFNRKRTEFDIPLAFAGSDFQQSVWQALMSIPYGKTETYLGLSKQLGNEKAIRAVASANGANAISILVPCHRIIGSNGSLTGYAGGLRAKKQLLKLEGALVEDQLSLF